MSHKNEKESAYLVESNDNDDDDSSEEINIVLITEEDDISEIFVAEASKSVVIDTARTKTMAGEKWFKNYTTNFTEKARKEILTHTNISSHYIRAHSCRVQLTNPNLDNNDLSQISNAIPLAPTNTPSSSDIPKPQPLTDTAIDTTDNDTDNEYENTTDGNTANERRNDNISNDDKKENSTTEHKNGSITRDKNTDLTKLKPDLEISFRTEHNEYCTAKVISRAGKSTGKYCACYNIEYKNPDNLSSIQTWINTKNLSNVTIIPSLRQDPAEVSNSELTYSVVEVFETQNISYQNAKKVNLQVRKTIMFMNA